LHKVIEELRSRIDASHQKSIARPCAGHIQKMTLRVLNFLKVRLIRYGFDALLQRQDLVVAGHDGDSTELKPFGKMHRADGDVPRHCLHVIAKYDTVGAGFIHGRSRPLQFIFRAHEDADLVRQVAFADPLPN
jgi:hypothetical protein